MRNDIDKLTLNALRKIRKNNPENIYQEKNGEINYRRVTNFAEIKLDIQKWKHKAIDDFQNGKKVNNNLDYEFLPDVIEDAIVTRLNQVEDEESINSVFNAVDYFYEKEREKTLSMKFEPTEGFIDRDEDWKDWEITEEDKKRAFARWDEVMPFYKGMLDAKGVNEDNPLKE